MKHHFQNPETAVIHAGQEPDTLYGGVSVPIYQSSTFAFRSAEHGAALFAFEEKGFIYTRIGNPTTKALEDCVAALEGGCGALGTVSGMAAVTTIYTAFLEKGAHVVSTASVYGPSRTVLEKEYARFGVEADFVDTSDLEAVEKTLQPSTKLLFIETPANPTMKVTDLESCARLTRERGILMAVDNTFASPILQNPLALGADIVFHSLTKFLNGHSDVACLGPRAPSQGRLGALSRIIKSSPTCPVEQTNARPGRFDLIRAQGRHRGRPEDDQRRPIMHLSRLARRD